MKILLVTPMLPPSLGGPAIHADKLYKYFHSKNGISIKLLNIEKFNVLPFGFRQLITSIYLIPSIFKSEIVFALDGFSAAIPSVLISQILRKKVILRIGGDLVHEQYVERGELVSMDVFYNILTTGKIKLPFMLKLKYLFQKFVIENSTGIVFNSEWQRDIYKMAYKTPKNVWVVINPVDLDEKILETIKKPLQFISATRDVKFKNLDNLKIAFTNAKSRVNLPITLETNTFKRMDLLSKIKESRCYICASVSDVSPNTVSDALLLGVPVILTKNTGYFNILKDSKVVRFINPLDLLDLEKAIIEMCDDNIYEEFLNNLKNFKWPQTWENLYLEYERIFKEVCNN